MCGYQLKLIELLTTLSFYVDILHSTKYSKIHKPASLLGLILEAHILNYLHIYRNLNFTQLTAINRIDDMPVYLTNF